LVSGSSDPLAARRARIARAVKLAKRVGYGLLAVAVVSFGFAAVFGFPAALLTLTVVTLVAACLVLPVPIVLGYGLRAAEREEREERRRAGGEPPDARR
jgi:hypothetical protein